MKSMRIISIIVTLFLWKTIVAAQNQTRHRPDRVYATQHVNQKFLRDTAVLKKLTKQHRENNDFKINGKFQNITIPVVFHMLYDQTSMDKHVVEIQRQLETLNEDFGGSNNIVVYSRAYKVEGFDKKLAKSDIKFCLGEGIGKNNGPAIIWKPVGNTEWTSADSMKNSDRGGSDPWDTQAYLNIWVCNMKGDTAGYAQMPGGPSDTDGIVIDFSYFGERAYAKAPYNKGKTLTHLVGSYLGLYELWNEHHRCADDEVEDTPIHNAPNTGQAEVYKHVSLCDGNPVEMNMNFMDNSDDESLFMFTEGQKYRIQSVLSGKGLRSGLSKGNSNCVKKFDDDMPLAERKATISPIEINLYPNPASSDVAIKLQSKLPISGEIDVLIYDETGRILTNSKFLENHTKEYPLDVKNMPNGKYFVSIRTEEFKATEVLIVTR
jgi:hypothetical protein